MIKKLLLTISLLILLLPSLSQARINTDNKESVMNPYGWTKKNADNTVFEVMDSDAQNIKVTSNKSLDIKITSIPDIVLIDIKKNEGNAKLSIDNLKPNTKYYKYLDNLHNLEELTTNNSGQLELKQDVKDNHLIILKTHRSTKFINSTDGGDCSQFGTWDSNTLTCTLTQDVNETIQIDSNSIILDGNNHTINPTRSNLGIYIEEKGGITIRNVKITNSSIGMMFYGIHEGIIANNEITSSNYGIWLQYSFANQITANSSNYNSYAGIYLYQSNSNVITANTTVSNGSSGIYINSGSINNNFSYNITKNNADGDLDFSDSYDGSICQNQISNTTGTGDKEIAFFNSTSSISNKEYSSLILCNANSSLVDNITVSGKKGIALFNTSGAKFSNITSSNNKYGIYSVYSNSNEIFNSKIDGDDYGFWSYYSDGNSIHNNVINNSINIDGSNTEIHHNTITNSPYVGIYLSNGYNNNIHNNNFINNAGEDISSSYDNPTVNNNYYSKNTNCTDADIDGYCDSQPYQVDWNISDSYPLKYPENTDSSFRYATLKADSIVEIKLNPIDTSETIKKLPNDWIVRVVNQDPIQEGTNSWLKIVDPTDDVSGYVKDTNFLQETDSQYTLRFKSDINLGAEERPSAIIKAIDHYYDDTRFDSSLYSSDGNGGYISRIKSVNYPKELTYGIAAQESGDIIDKFDNEIVSYDYGHGIMQNTFDAWFRETQGINSSTYDNRGIASNVIIPRCSSINSSNYLDCYEYAGVPYDGHKKTYKHYQDIETNPIYKQYSNKLQSVYANIKDGMQILASKTYTSFIENVSGNVIIGTDTYSESDRKNILTTWLYNGYTPDNTNCNYVSNVADKLDAISTYFPGVSISSLSDLIQKMHTVGQNAICTNLKSDYNTLTVSSSSNAIGMINGVKTNTFPFAVYDTVNNSIGILAADLNNDYSYTVNGNANDLYNLNITIKDGNESETFIAKDIPIKKSEKHIYKIDKEALKEGKNNAITIKVSGKTIKASKLLTGSDFIVKIKETENEKSK